MTKYTIHDCFSFSAPVISENNGHLYPIEFETFPFRAERMFLVSDVTHNTIRGKHAHKRCWQALSAITGEIELTVRDYNDAEATITLFEPGKFFVVPPSIWAEQQYKDNAILLCLCNEQYRANDYLRSEKEYKDWLRYA